MRDFPMALLVFFYVLFMLGFMLPIAAWMWQQVFFGGMCS